MRGWALFGALSVGAALITPFGVDGLVLPFTLVRMSYSLSVITEWQSPNEHCRAQRPAARRTCRPEGRGGLRCGTS
jgi:hypothetical protein